MIWKVIFIVALSGIFYAYIGYPLLLVILSIFKKKRIVKQQNQPDISIIITAYNEEKRIREKIENTLQLDYPSDKMQVIISSDGSTDLTNSIVKEYVNQGILLIEIPERGGKEHAQKEALKKANGQIIIFSDASTIIDKIGIREIVANFADPSIGCVSGMDKVIAGPDGQKGDGEGAYVKYEMAIRVLESSVNTVVGLSGSFFAARKEVCSDFSEKMDSDFRTLLNSRKMGLRGIVDPDAIGYYKSLSDSGREFMRKIRTVVRGLTVFFNSIEFCNIFRYGLFSIQYISHKLFKWLVPFFLVAVFIANLLLISESKIYLFTFLLQILVYIISILPLFNKALDKILFIKIPHFFILSNFAILIAWFKFVKGDRFVVWQPTKRN